MSKFTNGSSFFKRNTYQLDINCLSSKSSQKQQKKNKKTSSKSNNTNNNNITDDDFNKMMEENNNSNKNNIKLSDYLSQIKSPEILNSLLEEKIIGNDLVVRIESENISGSQLLKLILNTNTDPNNYNWIELNQYGLVLQFLLRDNSREQLLCLFLIQNYSSSLGFPKITYKDKPVYFLKIIFQLLFTYDIIDESVYWEWQEILTNITDIDEKTKNTICIQTADFFNILKMTFTDEDYEDENKDENNKQSQINIEKSINESESEDESEEESNNESDKIPECKDYNMDDNEDFNLDDI